MFKANRFVWPCAALFALACHILPAASMSEAEGVVLVSADQLPTYQYPIQNGYYATIAGYLNVPKVKVSGRTELNLNVAGFRSALPVQAVIQAHDAPLVVVLLGIGGRPNDEFNRLWQNWYAEAGYHVLSFDSTFLPTFNSRSHHGVAGNLWRESELARDVIQAFIDQSGVKDRLTAIGIVGMSYGGVEALMLGKMAADGKTPFAINAIQAWSPPVNMEHTANRMNEWLANDRRCYSLAKLDMMTWSKPKELTAKWPDSQMRAALAESFRRVVATTIVQNDADYNLRVLPRGTEFDDKDVRLDGALSWNFRQFAYDVSYPYWQNQLNLPSLQPLIDGADVCNLLNGFPTAAEVIIAQDDPLNSAEDLDRLKACEGKHTVTTLPTGGHMGYVSDDWTHQKLLTLFANVKTAR